MGDVQTPWAAAPGLWNGQDDPTKQLLTIMNAFEQTRQNQQQTQGNTLKLEAAQRQAEAERAYKEQAALMGEAPLTTALDAMFQKYAAAGDLENAAKVGQISANIKQNETQLGVSQGTQKLAVIAAAEKLAEYDPRGADALLRSFGIKDVPLDTEGIRSAPRISYGTMYRRTPDGGIEFQDVGGTGSGGDTISRAAEDPVTKEQFFVDKYGRRVNTPYKPKQDPVDELLREKLSSMGGGKRGSSPTRQSSGEVRTIPAGPNKGTYRKVNGKWERVSK